MVGTTYTMHRTQIYLHDGQVAKLKAAARSSSKTVSEFIREAIDGKLARAAEPADFERALSGVAGIWARRKDIDSADDYVHRLRRDERGSSES